MCIRDRFDTLLVCSLTCLAILCTGVWMQDGIETATMTATAFESTLGTTGTLLVAVCLFLSLIHICGVNRK